MPRLRDFLTEDEQREADARVDEMPSGPVDDPDNPLLTEADAARMRPASELPAEILAQFPNTKRRGRPATGAAKEHVSIRLPADVLGFFGKGEPGWQTRIEDALREHMARKTPRADQGHREHRGKPLKSVAGSDLAQRGKHTSAAGKVLKKSGSTTVREVASGKPSVHIGPIVSVPGSRLKKR